MNRSRAPDVSELRRADDPATRRRAAGLPEMRIGASTRRLPLLADAAGN